MRGRRKGWGCHAWRSGRCDRESLGYRLWEVSGEEAGGRGTAKVGGVKAGGVKVGGAKVAGGHHSQQESLCM